MINSSTDSVKKLNSINRRMFITGSLKFFIMIGLVSRLFFLQVKENKKYLTLSDKNRIREWKLAPVRGKITDYLLIVLVINLIVFFLLNKKVSLKKDFIIIQKILIITSVIALIIWFFKHPSLRYGGYLPITILITSLFMFFYSSIKFKSSNYKITKIFIILVITVFNLKNIVRLNLEFNRNDQYQFNNFPYYTVINKKYENFRFNGFDYMYVTNGYCWATPTPCSNTPRKIRIINNYIFFER